VHSQVFDLSLQRAASFKFGELSSADLHGKPSTNPSGVTAEQDGSRVGGNITGDQFVFKASLEAPDERTIANFEPEKSKTDLHHTEWTRNDDLHSNDTTALGGLISETHSSQDLTPSKNIIPSHLHASDFILPSH
jgi:hypothetical protein